MVANETIKQKGWRKLRYFAAALMCVCFLIAGCGEQQVKEEAKQIATDVVKDVWSEVLKETQKQSKQTTKSEAPAKVDGQMAVHFIDVGQADATLFVQGKHTMLFDAATRSRGDDLVKYITDLGIKKIDVLVLSHPHDDHMGGSAEVLSNIEVGKVYGPDIFDIKSLDNNKWYREMIDAVEKIDNERNKGVSQKKQTSIWNFPRNDKGKFANFKIGDAVVKFYAPLEDQYSDLNDYSICAKVTYGTIDVFLTADATDNVEKALIKKGYDLDVEVFQASHHGSDTGNSKEFLEAMSPECIVISCGKKNKYNHPVKSGLKLYKEMKLPVYRTDESGNIVMLTDGTKYSFNTKPGTYTSGEEYKAKGK